MKYIVLLTLCLSIYFFLRAFSFLMTYIDIYNYRAKMCIERILWQQKACDLLNAVYQSFVMLVTLCIAVNCVVSALNSGFIRTFNIVLFIAIAVDYIAYFVLRVKMETRTTKEIP